MAMGPLPHLNLIPRWTAVRTAVAGLDVTRLKLAAGRATIAATAAVTGAASKIDLARIAASARQAVRAAKPAAIKGWPILREIADPRGRCNRKAFLTIALAFLAIQLTVAALFWLSGIETTNTMNLVLNAPILWIGSTVCIKRLHDVGRSAWWLPGSFAIWFTTVILSLALISLMLDETAFDPGQPVFYVAFAAITLPVFGALLWLHTATSVAGANKYGPAAGPNGLSMPERGSVAAADAPAAPVANAA
jgi:uncharacterized membrane protein YhaH (DUF805 family)